MEIVTISRFKATCLEVLRKVQLTGQPVLITRRGEPVAEVRPPSPPAKPKRWLGSMEGTVTVHGDIVSPAAEADWDALKD